LPEAAAPLSITVRLEDEIDISRGDMLVHASHSPIVGSAVGATLVWMSERILHAGRPYLLKHAAQTVRARVQEDLHRIDMGTLAEDPVKSLALNEIGRVVIMTERPLFFDAYAKNRATGSLILIDPITNETVAAGMIAGAAVASESSERVTMAERQVRNGHRAAIVEVQSETTALWIERQLFSAGILAVRVAGETADLDGLLGAGAVIIVSGKARAEASTIRFAWDESQSRELLLDQLRRQLAL
jgi:hypothetical protein